jgi:large subunit ribosomal protein L6
MSLRTVKKPINIPKDVEVKVNASDLSIKGPKDILTLVLDKKVKVEVTDNELHVKPAANSSSAMTGTICAHIKNMLTGVTTGFSKKLDLVGVGYRAAMKGKDLSLSLGFSHPVVYVAPEGITIETPSQTEIIVRGANRQVVGQVAADIRGFRPPEPYKGKGVKYSNEVIIIKETKKK